MGPAPPADIVVDVSGLTRSFGRKRALDGVDLQVARGRVLGLVGENGAGKTTLIRHILGLLRAQTGTVRVFGQDPVRDPVAVLSRLGYLSEDRDLPPWMRIEELLSYTRAFYPRWDTSYAEDLRRAFELNATDTVRALSQGQRARLGLVLALAHRPELLVLDEPSTGLDPVVRRDILSAVIRTIAQDGRTVIFSSHLLDEVEQVVDTVAIMDEGRIVLQGALDAVLDTHWRVVLRFDRVQSRPPDVSGLFGRRGEDIEWSGIYSGRLDLLDVALGGRGGRVVEHTQASLEEIFVARVAARQPGRTLEAVS